jgi:hypothetical protein
MGRHVNADAGSDEGEAAEFTDGAETTHAEGASHEHARHAADTGVDAEAGSGILDPQAVISPDTHVGVDLDGEVTGAHNAAASPANPDALVEHGRVGDGHEME